VTFVHYGTIANRAPLGPPRSVVDARTDPKTKTAEKD
jgi:hypothetical protein